MSDFITQTLPGFVGTGDFVGGMSNAQEGGSLVPVGYDVVLNNQGAFFGVIPSGQTIGSSNDYADKLASIKGGGQQAKAFIMMHELAHVFGMFLPDANNRANQAYNNDLLWLNCGSLIQTLSNQTPRGGPQR